MTAQSKTTIKSYFTTGSRPTQTQFANLIDSYIDTSAAVVSAGLILPSIFTVSGSPITTSGNFRVSAASQSQRLFWAAPASASGSPIFRAIVASDLPTSQVIAPAITGYLSSSQTFTSNAIASMTIGAGIASDSTNTALLSGGPFSWNITNGNAINGYQGGTTLPNSTTIHFYVIAKDGLPADASFASSSLTPTLPATYTRYRRVLSLFTSGSGVLPLQQASYEGEGGSIFYWYNVEPVDISVTNLGSSYTQYALSVPGGIRVQPFYRINMPTNGRGVILYAGDEGASAPPAYADAGWTASPGYDLGYSSGTTNNVNPKSEILITDTSRQIAAYATGASTALYMVTRGFKDFRR